MFTLRDPLEPLISPWQLFRSGFGGYTGADLAAAFAATSPLSFDNARNLENGSGNASFGA